METSEITEAVREQATVHRAEGVLAVVLGVAPPDPRPHAQFGGVSLVEAARRVLDDHERRLDDTGTVPSELGDRTLDVLGSTWTTVGSPLDQPSAETGACLVVATGGHQTPVDDDVGTGDVPGRPAPGSRC